MSVVIIIPAYKPTQTLVQLVQDLRAKCSSPIVIVNDGSGFAYTSLFQELRSIKEVSILTHSVNLGKGAALKTGINFALCEFPDYQGVVTADADGQHLPNDILNVGRQLEASSGSLILGVRSWGSDVPFRSRIGNILTKYVFWFFTGVKVADTQTGLRGIPLNFCKHILRIKSTGYEFELDMLIASRKNLLGLETVAIETVYIENNKSSHFNPIIDSMKIYFVFVRFASVSMVTALLDFIVFYIAFFYSNNLGLSMVFGRTTGAAFQYLMSKNVVFKFAGDAFASFLKFASLVVVSGLVSYSMIKFISSYSSISMVWAKPLAELLLFFASFAIQREFIFGRKGNRKETLVQESSNEKNESSLESV